MRSSMFNVQALPDAFQSHLFDLFFPSIPGMSNTSDLTFKCQTSALPGFALDNVEIALQGVTKNEAGRAIYSHTMAATFLETVDQSTRAAFRNWREMIRSWENNSGSPPSAYKVNGELVLYDNIPNVVRTIKIFGMWPESVDEVQLAGNESNAVFLSVTFRFDWTKEI